MTAWRTTVTDAVLIFRDALRSLVPHVTRARIEWREGVSYDDWDDIAQTLFDKIVMASVLWGLPEEERSGTVLPVYDVMCDSYVDKSVIVVNAATGERLVFHSFATHDEPFDMVRARRVDGQGRVVSNEFVIVPCDAANFRVETPTRTIEELVVVV